MLATETQKNWDITDYSAQIRDSVLHLNEQHDIGIQMPYDAPTEYDALKKCRKHWAKLRKGGIELIKEKDYPQIRQTECIGIDHWRCTNHSKGTVYEITRDSADQYNCTCPASTHGSFCSHMEALFESPVYHQGLSGDQKTPEILSKSTVDLSTVRSVPCPGVVQPLKSNNQLVKGGEYSSSPLFVLQDTPEGREQVVAVPSVDDVRSASPLMLPGGLEATDDQANAFYGVKGWLADDKSSLYLINGYAGTGKTSLQQLLVEQLPWVRIAIVAPSNKAVRVIESKVSQVPGKVIETMTLAKLLAIRPRKDGDTQTFERDYDKDPLVGGFQGIILDEGSMTGDSSWQHLRDEMMLLLNRKVKCIVMGDIAQLPPVLEDISGTFAIEDKSELTNVIRNDGHVLNWVTYLRNNLTDAHIVKPQTAFEPDKSKGLWVLERNEWESMMVKAFTAAKEKGYHPDAVRALAWTNKRVNQLNGRIRSAINPGAKQFEIGDKLILNSPFALNQFGDDHWLQTAEELTVTREAIPGESQGIPIWQVQVQTADGFIAQIPVIKMSGRGLFEQRKKEFIDTKRFTDYWSFIESFCDVSYAYAMTVHCSQGSTFKDVFIDAKDICKCKDRTSMGTWLRNHLMYVGNSRASHRVFVTYSR